MFFPEPIKLMDDDTGISNIMFFRLFVFHGVFSLFSFFFYPRPAWKTYRKEYPSKNKNPIAIAFGSIKILFIHPTTFTGALILKATAGIFFKEKEKGADRLFVARFDFLFAFPGFCPFF